MKMEVLARLFALTALFGMPAGVFVLAQDRRSGGEDVVEVRARLPEDGGWLPGELTAEVGQPLRLRLSSDDVVHGFAVGKLDWPAVDLMPGQPVETIVRFDQPGVYTFYCTRWCGPDHWRMRGIIEVTGSGKQVSSVAPLYMEMGLDLDEPHMVDRVPSQRPSAERGARLATEPPGRFLAPDYYGRHSPAKWRRDLRADRSTAGMSDQDVWDLAALMWERTTASERLLEGERLYRENCAACHGETGSGDGVMADRLSIDPAGLLGFSVSARDTSASIGHTTVSPADFTDPQQMLGASPALLHGKIVRGGMGTGMPYWGPILTDDQIWALVEYLWTFQFDGRTPVSDDTDP
jgi:mono/diheme cytochrome c family protein/plastocyanin